MYQELTNFCRVYSDLLISELGGKSVKQSLTPIKANT